MKPEMITYEIKIKTVKNIESPFIFCQKEILIPLGELDETNCT